MRRHIFLLVVILATVTAIPKNTCLPKCKCQDQEEIATVGIHVKKIYDCSVPLTIDNTTFVQNTKKINKLIFDNVTIDKITNDAFVDLKKLEMLIFKNSKIGQIESKSFNLLELETVSFTNVRFIEIPNLISDFIETLIFSNCNLTKIPDLSNLSALTILQLNDNFIEHTDETTFAQLENLEELTLSNNNITKLPANIFEKNVLLNTLYLDNNPLEIFQLSTSTDLEFLSLKSCKLKTFDKNSSKKLTQLSQLDLSDNEIEILPIDAFEGIDNLNYIDLSNNKLHEVSDDIFGANCKLEKIVLNGNQFKKLPKFQCNDINFSTYYFSCNNCQLETINNGLDNMPGIVTLILSNNKINNISGEFSKIHGLRELDLSNNTIEKINGETFIKNTALQTLNLSGNPLKPLDPIVFTFSTILKKLDISNAGLTQLWTNHNAYLLNLEQLLIRNNNITNINEDDLNVTPKLKLIDLENNPFTCTKDLHDMIKWLINKSVYPIQGVDKIKTHDTMLLSDAQTFEYTEKDLSWKKLEVDACGTDTFFNNDDDDDDDDDNDDDDEDDDDDDNEEELPVRQYNIDTNEQKQTTDDKYDYLYDDYDNYDEEIKEDIHRITNAKMADNDMLLEETVLDNTNINLARASYILSVTSVFVLTALVVLTLAVAITLFILKKNGTFNMNNNNLPRLKIPLWYSTPTQKKHSGSVYRPLSEDLSGPKTPIINRYEFKSTPAVHSVP